MDPLGASGEDGSSEQTRATSSVTTREPLASLRGEGGGVRECRCGSEEWRCEGVQV